jgi:hypothetical protein
MTPEQINFAMPALIASATEQIDKLKVGEDFEMEEVLTRFTLDVAWRQILGELPSLSFRLLWDSAWLYFFHGIAKHPADTDVFSAVYSFRLPVVRL